MKKTFLTLIILTLTTTLFALPGFTPFIPDTAGEYVYYRDYSFARESYVGILAYDDTSYQIRYYAPASRELGQPETNLAILFAVNPESDFLDMTGEKIITDVDPNSDDVDILNYMHDLLYEFSSRRIKADPIKDKQVSISQDYEQFGGKVIICFDSLIPLFNIKTIKGQNNTVILSCVTFGRILNGDDKSFDNFKGLLEAQPYHAPTKKKIKAKAKKVRGPDGQTITLDKNWDETDLENCWVYGNEAFLTIASVPSYFEDQAINDIFVLRRIAESTDGSYMDFENIELTIDSKKHIIKILTKCSQPESNRIVYIIKQLTTDPAKEINSYLSLAAYEDSYLEKSSYYTKLLKTFKD